MDLIYGIKDRPRLAKVVLFALQQLLAIMAATIAVPAIIGHGLSASAALFGAGGSTMVRFGHFCFACQIASPVETPNAFAA